MNILEALEEYRKTPESRLFFTDGNLEREAFLDEDEVLRWKDDSQSVVRSSLFSDPDGTWEVREFEPESEEGVVDGLSTGKSESHNAAELVCLNEEEEEFILDWFYNNVKGDEYELVVPKEQGESFLSYREAPNFLCYLFAFKNSLLPRVCEYPNDPPAFSEYLGRIPKSCKFYFKTRYANTNEVKDNIWLFPRFLITLSSQPGMLVRVSLPAEGGEPFEFEAWPPTVLGANFFYSIPFKLGNGAIEYAPSITQGSFQPDDDIPIHSMVFMHPIAVLLAPHSLLNPNNNSPQ